MVAKIKIGSEIENIQAELNNNALINVPLRIPISSDRIFIIDYKNTILKVFLKNGNLDYIVGKIKGKKGNLKFIDMKLQIPGLVGVSEEDTIYIQNRIGSAIPTAEFITNRFQLNSGYFSVRDLIHVPSYIHALNHDKNDFLNIGQEGLNSEPFRYIESISTGNKGKLFVIHRIAEELILSYFIEGKINGKIKESEISILKNSDPKFIIKLENIIPNKNGDYALVSFQYIGKDDERFKFRRIYKYHYNQTEPSDLIKELQDPSEILFGIKQTGEFYIWETKVGSNHVKLQLHDKEGNHIKNFRLDFSKYRNYWRETYMDYNDSIYSIKIDGGHLELYEWL
jgi:hypothetical protein